MHDAVVIMCLLPQSRWAPPQAVLVIYQFSAHGRMTLSRLARALRGGIFGGRLLRRGCWPFVRCCIKKQAYQVPHIVLLE